TMSPARVHLTESYDGDMGVMARILVDGSDDEASSFPGVCLYVNPLQPSEGYCAGFSFSPAAGGNNQNLVVRDGTWREQAQPFSWVQNQNYWFRFQSQGPDLYLKVWPDNAAEPVGWSMVLLGWNGRRHGAP